MQLQRPVTPPGVIFDSDMGVNIDTAFALAILYGAPTKVKVVGLTVTNPKLEAAAFCDVVARYYTTGGRLKISPPLYHFPIGYAGGYAGEGGRGGDDQSGNMLTKALALKAPDGSPVFGVNVEDLSDTGEVAIVIRNALSAQKDGAALMVSAGPATNLVRALALPGNKDLIAANVGTLVLAAGDLSGTSIDPRIKADIAAARRVFTEWPGNVVIAGRETGAALAYPGASIAADFAWAETHPILEAYKAWKPAPYDVPSQAMLAALYATDPKGELWKLSEPGRIEVLDDGRTRFTAASGGKHRYLLTDSNPEWKASVVKAIATLASAKPTAPGGRGRGGAVGATQQQQAQPLVKPAQP